MPAYSFRHCIGLVFVFRFMYPFELIFMHNINYLINLFWRWMLNYLSIIWRYPFPQIDTIINTKVISGLSILFDCSYIPVLSPKLHSTLSWLLCVYIIPIKIHINVKFNLTVSTKMAVKIFKNNMLNIIQICRIALFMILTPPAHIYRMKILP